MSRHPRHLRLIKLLPLIFFTVPAAKGATSFIIQLVADNDFAFYAGSDTTITRDLYQNPEVWTTQVSASSAFNFELEAGETFLYVLAMGGGGQENLSGRINEVNIVQSFLEESAAVQMSNPVTAFLSAYNTGLVANGTYTPLLADVQTALASAPTWGNPTVNSSQTVIASNPLADNGGTRQGFIFGDSTAVLFRLDPEAVGLDLVPEPSSTALLGMVLISFLLRRRR